MNANTPDVPTRDQYIKAVDPDAVKARLADLLLTDEDLSAGEFDGVSEKNLGKIWSDELAAGFAWEESPETVQEVWEFCKTNYGLPEECRKEFCEAIEELVEAHGLELETEGGFLVNSLAEIIRTGEITLTEDALRRFNQADEEKRAGPSWKAVGIAGLLGAGALVFGQMLKQHRQAQAQKQGAAA